MFSRDIKTMSSGRSLSVEGKTLPLTDTILPPIVGQGKPLRLTAGLSPRTPGSLMDGTAESMKHAERLADNV